MEVVSADGEVVTLTWGDDAGTTGSSEVELLTVASTATATKHRWLDHNSDGQIDELWIDTTAPALFDPQDPEPSDPTVNYFYDNNAGGVGDDTLEYVTVTHADATDDAAATPCTANPPTLACEHYEHIDPRTPADTNYLPITKVTDPSGRVVVENAYELSPHTLAVSASAGDYELSVDGGTGITAAYNETEASLAQLLSTAVAGTTVDSVLGVFRISWGDGAAHSLTVNTTNLTGTATVGLLTGDSRWSRPRVLSQEMPTGTTVGFTYDIASNFTYGSSQTASWDTQVVFDDGVSTETVTYHHDENGYLVGITDPYSESVEKTYTNGQTTGFVDRTGVSLNRSYDTAGRITGVTYPDPGDTGDAASEYVAYTASGQPSTVIDRAGGTTTYTYDSDPEREIPHRIYTCALQEDPTNGVTAADACPTSGPYTEMALTTVANDGVDGLVKTVTEPADQTGNQVTTTFTYDYAGTNGSYPNCAGTQVCAVQVGTATTRYEYDPVSGNANRVIDPLGAVSAMDYDVAGRLVRSYDPIAWADWETEPEDDPGSHDFDGTHYATDYGYDPAGRLIWVSGPDNPYIAGASGSPSTSTTYTADGQVQATIESLDHSQTCPVDAGTGNPVSTAGVCVVTANTYDGAGRPKTTTVADDGDTTVGEAGESTTTYTVGDLGRVTKTVDPVGTVTQFCYDANGNQTHRIVGDVTDPCTTLPTAGAEIYATVYDDWGRVACTADAETSGVDLDPTCAEWTDYTAFTYDGAGRTLTRTDTGAAGTGDDLIYTTVYDHAGRVTSRSASAGYDWSTNAWTGGNETVVSHSSIEVEARTYYPSGRLKSTITPPTGVFTYTGSLAAHADRLETTYEYDPAGRVAKVTTPEGIVGTTTYDAAGRATATTQAVGTADELTLTTTFDSLGRPVSRGRPGPWSYLDTTAATGTFDVQVDTNTAHTGQTVGMTPAALATLLSGDVAGTTVAGTAGAYEITWGDGQAHTLTIANNAAVWAHDGVRDQRTYDPAGRVIAETDFAINPAVAATRDFVFDDAGRLVGSSDAAYTGAGTEVTYTYDLQGNRTSRCTLGTGTGCTGGRLAEWAYDAAGRVTTETNIWGNDTTYLYDNDTGYTGATVGRLWETTDPEGRQTTLTYTDGRVTAEDYTHATATNVHTSFTYDEFGRRTQASYCENAGGTSACTPNIATNYLYDRAGRMIQADGPDTADSIQWAWDLNGDLRQTKLPAGSVHRWRHDKDRRTTNLDGLVWGVWITPTSYDYDNLNRRTRAYHSGLGGSGLLERAWTYGDDTRINTYSLCWDWNTTTDSCDQTNYHDQTITWRPDGRVATDSTRTNAATNYRCRHMTYDTTGQLTRIDADQDTACDQTPALATEWEMVYTAYGEPDELCDGTALATCSGFAYTDWSYADNHIDQTCIGATVANCPTGALSTPSFDDAGYYLGSAGTGFAGTYAYDARGKFESLDLDSTTATPDWDYTHDAIGDLTGYTFDDGTTPVTRTMVWDHTTAIPQIVDLEGIDQGYGPDERVAQPSKLYETDAYGHHLYNPDTYPNHPDDYGPFGKPRNNHSQTNNPDYFGYRGEFHATYLLHLRNRTLNTQNGTFTTPDPLDDIDGTPVIANPYHYADNDPLNKTDPLGLRPDDSLGSRYGNLFEPTAVSFGLPNPRRLACRAANLVSPVELYNSECLPPWYQLGIYEINGLETVARGWRIDQCIWTGGTCRAFSGRVKPEATAEAHAIRSLSAKYSDGRDMDLKYGLQVDKYRRVHGVYWEVWVGSGSRADIVTTPRNDLLEIYEVEHVTTLEHGRGQLANYLTAARRNWGQTGAREGRDLRNWRVQYWTVQGDRVRHFYAWGDPMYEGMVLFAESDGRGKSRIPDAVREAPEVADERRECGCGR